MSISKGIGKRHKKNLLFVGLIRLSHWNYLEKTAKIKELVQGNGRVRLLRMLGAREEWGFKQVNF